MALRDCLDAAVGEGELSREAADEALERFDDLVEDGVERGRLSRDAAELRAAQRLEADLERARVRRKRARILQTNKLNNEILPRIQAADKKDKAALAFLEFDPLDRHTTGSSVAGRHEVIRGEAWSIAADFLDKFRSRAAGLTRDVTELPNVVRALFGESTSAEAKALAEAYTAARLFLVRRFNSAGGDIRLRKDWGAAQHHNREKIAATAKDDYVNWTIERLDPEKMSDAAGQPLTLRQLRSAVEGTYDELTQTAQRSEVNDFSSPIQRHTGHRELVFANADAWIEYQERFGSGDILAGMVGDIDRLARETALIEVLGPHPRATVKAMQEEAVGGNTAFIRRLFDEVSGTANVPGTSPFARTIASGNQAWRNLSTAGRLGSAIIPSTSDFFTSATAARLNGVGGTRILGSYLEQLTNSGSRQLAAKAGYVHGSWTGDLIAAQRMMGEVTGSGITARAADTVLRASGLAAHTEGLRAASRLEFVSSMTEMAGRSFDDLEPGMKRMFRNNNITPEDWELYRSTPLFTDPETGAEMILPRDVHNEFIDVRLSGAEREARFNAANKIGEMIFSEVQRAVVFPTNRVRAMTVGWAPPGTAVGESIRHGMLFRSWILTATVLHGGRIRSLVSSGERGVGALYAAAVAGGLTVSGAASVQFSQVARGKDPLDMLSGEFWLEAAVRGGSFGALGDLFAAAETRFGGGWIDAIAGPSAQDIQNAINFIKKGGSGENPTRELRRLAQGLLPGNTLWYARTAFERLVLDQLEMLADKDAKAKFRRAERRARRERDQRFFFRPGRTTPERGPDIGAAFGG